MEPLFLKPLPPLDRSADQTLTVQLYRALLAAIRAGDLTGSLPSSRAAAGVFGVARNTVNAAYELLEAEGAVTIRRGAAPVILGRAAPTPTLPIRNDLPRLSERGRSIAASGEDRDRAGPMTPGQPDPDLFPRDLWARLLRRAARLTAGAALGYRHYTGLPALQEALARRLTTDRGMVVTPEQILVTPGAQASLTLLALTLGDPGDTALIEDPGYSGAKMAFRLAGLKLHPLPVDAEGADCGPAPAARLIYLTPANQYPLGVRLSLARRAAFLDHARRHDAVIVEDDYDSEFLWHGRPIAAFQPEAPERIVTIGTAAKALTPGLRLGWIVAPPGLAAALAAAQRSLGLAANVHAQAALAALIEDGRYRAHLFRIAATYGERGRAFARALRAIPGVEAADPSGGVQLTIRLPAGSEAAAHAAVLGAGFAPAALSAFCIGPGQSGLVAGFADATPERIAGFCAALARALKR
ncbi:PLP-dependent aminotransferase family protein [Frigidibacter sp. RF13]|uniref:aminotransferase-like domain-containing protein n=1 Tax=Frigidibacter sp. RF13 TaxID=2997340 RepID=UPI00226F9868|nr:PLP-dependent aminotransferase family protein [Frigidibacter sp. RF13]MCY1127421.1 PLP-dependent aminotransferase family protein [Frigidibacter sp. RF13]